jgi:hypothetical protein
MDARTLPARGAGQPSEPPRLSHDAVSGGQVTGARAFSGSSPAAHAGMHEAAADDRADARPAAGKAPVCRIDARTLPLRLPVIGMEAARGRQAGSHPQLEQADTAKLAADHETGGSLGASMGGTSLVPFRAPTSWTLQQGDKIPLGSFHTVESAARAHDGWAAATPERALGVMAGDERGSARAPHQGAAPARMLTACRSSGAMTTTTTSPSS